MHEQLTFPKRVRIVGTGEPFETHVHDADTGEEVAGITSMDLTITPDGIQCVLYVSYRIVIPTAAIAELDLTAKQIDVVP
jgi:hypothetical protein